MKNKYKNKYRTQSIRKPNWNYSSPNWYFVTVCTKYMEMYFGDVEEGEMKLNEMGTITYRCWLEIPIHFPHVEINEFVIMPNHVHGIITINKMFDVETQNFASLREMGNKFGPQSKNLGSIVRGFKIGVKNYSTMNNIPFNWQSNYHDRIIRNEFELSAKIEYIFNNPARWDRDRNNKERIWM